MENQSNKEVARELKEVAAALKIKGKDRFRIMAYEKAANSVESLNREIKTFWEKKNLGQIPGIGLNLAKHLEELLEKGFSRHFKKLKKGLPPALFILMNVEGLGPKKAAKLCQDLGIWRKKRALERILKAARKNKIQTLSGFGPDSQRMIAENVKNYLQQREGRVKMLFPYAKFVAEEIISYLKKNKKVIRADCLGSLRRGCALIGDIDISVATKEPQEVLEWFSYYPEVKKVVELGQKKAMVFLTSGRQIDLYVQAPEKYGSLLQHFTGSKEHNIHLRELALLNNFSLSEHGVKKKGGKKRIFFKDEKELYQFLKLEWIPPELRENQGEIEAAAKGKLPYLIELKEIKGDLQLHSDFDLQPSHDLGQDSYKIMVEKAFQLNYKYLGFTEHNPRLSGHSVRQIISLLSRKKEKLVKLNDTSIKKFNIGVLNGLEVDIRPDGSLALPPKAFSLLDYLLVSIHSRFDLPAKQMTKRILTALSHPKAIILGHPTGRILNRRQGYQLDWEEIFAFCLKNNKVLEINASPKRLDLPDALAREAIKKGIRLVINTDAHSVEQMEFMEYGVLAARRAWAQKENIVNCYSFEKVCEIMGIRKGGEV